MTHPDTLPAEPADPAARRREKMLAWHLGALDEQETALIAGRLESDPEWQRASQEAERMLAALRADADAPEVPDELAAATLLRLRETVAPTPRQRKPSSHSWHKAASHEAEARKNNAREADAQEDDETEGARPAPPPWRFGPRLAAAAILLAALPAVWLGARYLDAKKPGPAIAWRADGKLTAGAPFAPDLAVRDAATGEAQSGLTVQASLRPKSGGAAIPIGEGRTGPHGRLAGTAWKVPEVRAGEYMLELLVKDAGGRVVESAQHAVRAVGSARLALSPDRVQARPGETLRVRALLAQAAGEKPIPAQQVTLDLVDPQGNRIGRERMDSTRFGLTWAEFPLDSEAPEGSYTLRAEAMGLSAERTVTVAQYRLPPFKVALDLEKGWIRPNETLRGTLRAVTFDGHPVANAKGTLTVALESGEPLTQSEIASDGEGMYKFAIALPRNPLGPNAARARLRLRAELTDPAERRAEGSAAAAVSESGLLAYGVPEGLDLVQGLENRVYVVLRTPGGEPLRGAIEVYREGTTERHALSADAQGVAVVTLAHPQLPQEVLRVRLGEHTQRVALPVRPLEAGRPSSSGHRGALLLRVNRAACQAGNELALDVFAPEEVTGEVALALQLDGQTIGVGAATLSGGRGKATLRVPEGAAGMLGIEARLPRPVGQTWTDRRFVHVSSGAGLKLAAASDKAQYRPGETARLSFHVTNAKNEGVPAAVSVVALDRALVELTGTHPGLAQAFQTAEMNLLAPPEFPLEPHADLVRSGSDDAARASLAGLRLADANGLAALVRQQFEAGRLRSGARDEALALLQAWKSGSHEGETSQALALRRVLEGEPGGKAILAALEHRIGDRNAWIDNKAQRIREAHQASHEASLLFRQAVMALLAALVLIGVVYAASRTRDESRREARKRTEWAVPGATLAATVVAFAAYFVFRSEQASIFVMALACLTALAHTVFLWRIHTLTTKAGVHVPTWVTLILDGIFVIVGWYALVEMDAYRAWMPGLCLAGIGAAFIQACAIGFHRDPIAFTVKIATPVGVCVLVGLVLLVAGVSERRMAKSRQERVIISNLEMPGREAEFKGEEFMNPVPVHEAREEATFTSPDDAGKLVGLPRLRMDFREAWIFAPELVTDEHGKASLALPVADSLTAWQVLADAIAAEGGVASRELDLTVTQPFSVDLTLPPDLTAGDRLVVPAVVSNHTEQACEVRLALKLSGATALDGLERTLALGPKALAAAEFHLAFDQPGEARLELTARAGEEADAVLRTLRVIPDGRPVAFAASRLVRGEATLEVPVPPGAIPGTVRSSLTFHRGPLTQMLSGLEAMLREPHGCFEQTSSTNYPNIMVLRYLKAHGMDEPAVAARAREFLARGYQRLLGFEVPGERGGFSLYGHAPASTWLSAYGLMQFQDLATVQPVDEALLERTRAWLTGRVASDGSIALRESAHGIAPQGELAGTAYVVWALREHAPAASVDYLRRNRARLEADGYLCALAANALAGHDRALAATLAGKLSEHVTRQPEGGENRLSMAVERTIGWSYERDAATEGMGLAALALLELGENLPLAGELCDELQRRMQAGGMWGTTQATVLALKALEKAAARGGHPGASRVVVQAGAQPLAPVELPEGESASPLAVPLDLERPTALKVAVSGRPVAVHAGGEAFVSWESLPAPTANPLNARVVYDRTTVLKGQRVLGTLTVSSVRRSAEVPMVEWGLPAGFVPEAADLDALTEKGRLRRWERSGRKLRLYLPDLAAGQKLDLAVRFTATAKGSLKGAPGRVWEYYRRDEAAPLAPGRFVVE